MSNMPSAMLAAMMRAEPGDPNEPPKLPSNSYVEQGGFLDWLQSLLPDALSGRKAAIKNLERLQQIDEMSKG